MTYVGPGLEGEMKKLAKLAGSNEIKRRQEADMCGSEESIRPTQPCGAQPGLQPPAPGRIAIILIMDGKCSN